MDKRYYQMTVSETIADCGSREDGLSAEEAATRLAQNGRNKLAEGKKIPLWRRFLSQLADPMILILIAAAVISGVTAALSGEGGYADVIIIVAVVLINAILGVVQEAKAEEAIAALKNMAAPTAKVIRGGERLSVPTEELVVGDIILLEAGDAVPADARLIEAASLKCEESAMTGESVPVGKHTDPITGKDGGAVPLGDRKNTVYMGSSVVYGRGTAVVTATGMQTEMGHIADALAKAEDEQTPLQIKLAHLSRILTFLVLGICVVIFGVSLLRAGKFTLPVILDTFIVAVSLAVAAIPEGLAAVVTVDLSLGVTRMSKQGAIIRKLSAVETLGCTQIICSDKTGTLTQNRMTVADHYGTDEKHLALAFSLCTDATVGEDGRAQGDPTQTAVVDYATSLDLNKNETEKEYHRVGEIPFDSGRKLMTTVHRHGEEYFQFTTGAPDVVLSRCTSLMTEAGVVPMTDERRAECLAANKALADQAYRVLAAAQIRHETAPTDYTPAVMENGLCFLGLVGMIDPVRPEVGAAIEKCKTAGIRPVMITGDHRDTAAAIARQLGILREGDLALTGAELDAIPEEEFRQNVVSRVSVYARVQPEHKTRIVEAWKSLGNVVAMTGDGVNDAPSIKAADIGVGMGITGTDVTKSVADMILTDDNFATIVKAAEEGRRIYDNIRRAIRFLLSSNMAEVFAVFTASMIGFTLLKPTHLLWINLITDTFPALALGLEAAEPNVMTRPPRKKQESLFAGGMGISIFLQGILIAALTLGAYFIGDRMGGAEHGMTVAFLTMSLSEIFHSYNLRSEKQSIFCLPKHNFLLLGAMLFSFAMTAAVIFIPPLASAFGFSAIGGKEYGIAILLALVVIPVEEIIKIFRRRK